MSILVSRTYVVPIGFIVMGLLALSAPVPASGVLLLCAVIGPIAAMIAWALRRGSTERLIESAASRLHEAPHERHRGRGRSS